MTPQPARAAAGREIVALVAALLVAAAVAGTALIAVRRPALLEVAEVPPARGGPPAEPRAADEPAFGDPIKEAAFFRKVVEGERRALSAVAAARRGAGRAALHPEQARELAALEAEYEARIRRHEARLRALGAPPP